MANEAKMAEWVTGWTAENPLVIGHNFTPNTPDSWKIGESAHVQYRDLGLAEASGDLLSARHVRLETVPKSVRDWHCHDLDFQFFYVLKGSLAIENETGENAVLRAGGVGYQPRLVFHRVREVSDSCEMVVITGPATFGSISRKEAQSLETRAPEATRRPYYLHDTPEAWGRGLRSFQEYRDLGTSDPTDGRIYITNVRTAKAQTSGISWHYHTMGQFFMVLDGQMDFEYENEPKRTLRKGDAMCLGGGPHARHSITNISAGQFVLELIAPAKYDTIAVDTPSVPS